MKPLLEIAAASDSSSSIVAGALELRWRRNEGSDGDAGSVVPFWG